MCYSYFMTENTFFFKTNMSYCPLFYKIADHIFPLFGNTPHKYIKKTHLNALQKQ